MAMSGAKRALRAPAPDAAERALIEHAQRDPRRFADLYEAHFERVYAFVVRRVHDRAEAEDVTADVFHHALAHLPHFEWRGVPFAAWLFRIATNALIDRAKRAARERALPHPDDPVAASPEDTEQRAQLFRLVDRLPASQRRVLVMRFGEEKTIREIATAVGRTEGAVKQLQLRGLQRLRAFVDVRHA